MKLSFTALTVLAAGLLILATSCQQTNKGESKSSWQLKSPGTAAGYGSPPLDTGARKETSPGPPTGEYRHGEAAPTMNEPAPQQPATGGNGPSSSKPTLKIEPPPSAAGYGRPTMDKPAPQQPATGGYGPSPSAPSWKIVPPPSAAGYGK